MAPLTNQASLTMAQELQLLIPRATASKGMAPGAMGECGQGAGEAEGGLGSRRPVTWEGEGEMDHPSLPSKCFASGLGSELDVWHPSYIHVGAETGLQEPKVS